MNIFDSIMSPLGREHCMIFYYIGLITFFFAIASFVLGLMFVFNKKTNTKGGMFLLNSITLFITYYLYRIVYSMCVKSM